MDGLPRNTGNLQNSIPRFYSAEHRCRTSRPYLRPACSVQEHDQLNGAFQPMMRSAFASVMRRTADVDPELIRTAEIRAMTDPS